MESSKAVFHRCVWRNFDSNSICKLENQQIEILDSTIENGTGKSLFSNRNGNLYLNRVSTTSIYASEFIVSSESGISIIEDSTFSTSYLDYTMLVLGNASQAIRRTQFLEMSFLGNIFKVEDIHSSMAFNTGDVLNNVLESSWRNEPQASVIFSRFLLTEVAKETFGSSEKMHDKVTYKSDVSSIAFSLNAFVNVEKEDYNENDRITSEVFKTSQQDHLEVVSFFLETV